MASSMKHARQIIVHGRVSVSGLRTKFPSYLVTADEEGRVGWFRGEPKRAEGVKKKHARRGVDAAESACAAAQAEQPEIIEEGAAAEETVEEAG